MVCYYAITWKNDLGFYVIFWMIFVENKAKYLKFNALWYVSLVWIACDVSHETHAMYWPELALTWYIFVQMKYSLTKSWNCYIFHTLNLSGCWSKFSSTNHEGHMLWLCHFKKLTSIHNLQKLYIALKCWALQKIYCSLMILHW